MAEEVTNPVQAVPVQEEPIQAVQAAQTEPDPPQKKKGSPLLVFLTVLLVLVGIADLGLWGLAGYYFLRSL